MQEGLQMIVDSLYSSRQRNASLGLLVERLDERKCSVVINLCWCTPYTLSTLFAILSCNIDDFGNMAMIMVNPANGVNPRWGKQYFLLH